jgi:hypothetical protein
MLLRSVGLLFVLSATSRSLFADVLIGNGPASPFTSVQAAVDAAHDGDVVMLPHDVHEDIVVDGKGIAIVGDTAGQLTWFGHLHVQNVPAGSTMLLTGIGFGQASSTPVVLTQNAGAIRFQSCSVWPAPNQPATVGVLCTSSRDVAFMIGGIHGGQGPFPPFAPIAGAAAISATDSTITIQSANVGGGNGRPGFFDSDQGIGFRGSSGGPALLLSGGTLVTQSVHIVGGFGGDGFVGDCAGANATAGGAGGTGIVLTAGAVARAIGGRTLGGVGGHGGVNPCGQAPPGATGVDVDAGGGTWTKSAGAMRSLGAQWVVRAGDPVIVSVSGESGEHVFLAAGSAPAHVDSPSLGGVLLVQPQFRRVDFGPLDAQGQSSFTIKSPAWPPGTSHNLLHLQALMVGADGRVHLGVAGIVVLLDP